MDYYSNAVSWHTAAINSTTSGDYQQAVYSSCLAIELYLKSKVAAVSNDYALLSTHDIIGLYNKVLMGRFGKNKDVETMLPKVRKYFNESRYPYDIKIFDDQLADQFLAYINNAKDYIDNQCVLNQKDLLNRYNKK